MQLYHLSKEANHKEKIIFSLIVDGNKSLRRIREAAGVDTKTVQKAIQNLIEQGYISSDLEPLVEITRKYVHVEPPKHPNLHNWISAALPAIIESYSKSGRKVDTRIAAKWLGISEYKAIKCENDMLRRKLEEVLPEVLPDLKPEVIEVVKPEVKPEVEPEVDIERLAWEQVEEAQATEPQSSWKAHFSDGYPHILRRLHKHLSEDEATACARLISNVEDLAIRAYKYESLARKFGIERIRAEAHKRRAASIKYRLKNEMAESKPEPTDKYQAEELQWIDDVMKVARDKGWATNRQEVKYALDKAFIYRARNPPGYARRILEKKYG